MVISYVLAVILMMIISRLPIAMIHIKATTTMILIMMIYQTTMIMIMVIASRHAAITMIMINVKIGDQVKTT